MDEEQINPSNLNFDANDTKPKKQDTLNILKNPKLIELLSDGETLIWSGEMYKINKYRKRQKRRFFMTNRRFFNVGDESFMNNL